MTETRSHDYWHAAPTPTWSAATVCRARAACSLQILTCARPLTPLSLCVAGWVREECAPKDGGVGRSLLHHAAWVGDLSIFKKLVEAGADVTRQRNTAWRPNGGVRGRGATPLHHAVMYNRKEIVDYILNTLGVPVDLPGEQGYTPLHLAAKFNYPELVEFLLEHGARTDMLTRDEKTAPNPNPNSNPNPDPDPDSNSCTRPGAPMHMPHATCPVPRRATWRWRSRSAPTSRWATCSRSSTSTTRRPSSATRTRARTRTS